MGNIRLLNLVLFLTVSFHSFGQKYCSKDTMFKWTNLRLFYLGFEVGSGLENNYKLPINNFNRFAKVEFGARIYVKKFVVGWRGGFLPSSDKNAGNVNNLIVNGKFDNRQTTIYTGFMATSPKYIMIEPCIYYTVNKGLLFYDSVQYGKYSDNRPEIAYKIPSFGAGFNAYINLYPFSPKLFSGFLPLYLYTQVSFLCPTEIVSPQWGHLQNFSIGITMFPFFYNKRYGHF